MYAGQGEDRGHCTLCGGGQGSRTDTVTLGAFVTWHLTWLCTGQAAATAAAGSGRKVKHMLHIHTKLLVDIRWRE